jgi:N-acyl homoserine lactone hydrolase
MSTLRLHVFNTGWFTKRESQLYLGGGATRRTLPVLAFVIEHPQGLLVFDTGLNAAIATDPRDYLGWIDHRLLPYHSKPGMHLSAQMRARGLAPEDVTHVVLSHLHYGHTGDLHAFPSAHRLLSCQEWQTAHSRMRRLRGYLSREYAALQFTLIEFSIDNCVTLEDVTAHGYGLDVIGDGSLVLVPTFGHTNGHQSLLVFLPHGAVLLAGDAVYVQESVVRPVAQPRPRSSDMAWRSLMGLRALAKGDHSALIVPSHDDSVLRGIERPDVVMNHEHAS